MAGNRYTSLSPVASSTARYGGITPTEDTSKPTLPELQARQAVAQKASDKANSPLGIAANTVAGIPKAAGDVGNWLVGAAQGLARGVADIGTAAGNAPFQASRALGSNDPNPFPDSIPTNNNPISNAIFGGKPILPNAPVEMGQTVARDVASVGMSAGNLPAQIPNKLFGTNIPVPFADSIPTAGNPVSNAIFGGKPVETVQKQAAGYQESLTPYVGAGAASALKYPLVAGGIALDLMGLGGSAEKGALVTAEQLVKHFAEEKNPMIIFDTLVKTKMPPAQAAELAPKLAAATTEQGVRDILTGQKVTIPTGAVDKVAEAKATSAVPEAPTKFDKYLEPATTDHNGAPLPENVSIFRATDGGAIKPNDFVATDPGHASSFLGEGALGRKVVNIEVPKEDLMQVKMDSPYGGSQGELVYKPKPLFESTAAKTATPLETSAKAQAEAAAKMPPEHAPEGLPEIVDKKFPPTPYGKRVTWWDRFATTPQEVLNKIGLGDEAKALRTAYEKYTAELKVNMKQIDDWAKNFSPESNIKIFKFLDGQGGNLTAAEAKTAGEIKTWLSQFADRQGLPQDKRITDYITHIWNGKGEIPEEIAKLIEDKQPGSVYSPYLLTRQGAKGFKEDTWASLEAYAKTSTRKINMDPALESLKTAAEGKLSDVSQVRYVKDYADLVNMRPSTLDTSIDNQIKAAAEWGDKTFKTDKFLNTVGARPTMAVLRTARAITSAARLGLSFLSAAKNLTQGVNTFAELGTKYTTTGYLDLMRKGTKELDDVGVMNLSFVEDRKTTAIKSAWRTFDKVTYYNFELTERINRGAAYYGAKAKALDAGKTEAQAIEYGKEIARKTQFQFGSIDTPVGLQNEIAKTLVQFQTFNIKQIEFVKNMFANKEYASLARYVASSAVVYGTIGGAFGLSMANVIPSFKFGTPPAVDIGLRIYNDAMGTQNQYGQTPTGAARLRDFGNAVLTEAVPGGTQINRTIGGLQAVGAGKSTTAAGNYQYTIPQTPMNYVRGALFGKSNLPEAKAYQKKKSAPASSNISGKRYQGL